MRPSLSAARRRTLLSCAEQQIGQDVAEFQGHVAGVLDDDLVVVVWPTFALSLSRLVKPLWLPATSWSFSIVNEGFAADTFTSTVFERWVIEQAMTFRRCAGGGDGRGVGVGAHRRQLVTAGVGRGGFRRERACPGAAFDCPASQWESVNLLSVSGTLPVFATMTW